MKYRIKEHGELFYIEVEIEVPIKTFFNLIEVGNGLAWKRCGKDGKPQDSPHRQRPIPPPVHPFKTKVEAVKQIKKFKKAQVKKDNPPKYWDENGNPFLRDTTNYI